MRLALVAALSLIAPDAIAAEMAPMPAAARGAYERGIALYRDGKYAEAVRELEAALARTKHRDVWYALAQTQRKLGRCEDAIASYREFVSAGPPAEEARRAQLNIERCEAEIRDRPSEPPPVASAPIEPRAAPERMPSLERPRRDQVVSSSDSYDSLKTVGLGVAGAGVVVMGFGAYFAFRARSDWNVINDAAARHETWSPSLERRYDSAESAETKATVLFVAGSAVVVAGGVLYYLAVSGQSSKQHGVLRALGQGGRLGCAF